MLAVIHMKDLIAGCFLIHQPFKGNDQEGKFILHCHVEIEKDLEVPVKYLDLPYRPVSSEMPSQSSK